MRKLINNIITGIGLIFLSVLIFLIQIIIFNSKRDTFFYLFQDLAFIPIQVLLITLILNRFLSKRQKREMLKKMNMVIGAFYISVGTELISKIMEFHNGIEQLNKELLITSDWNDTTFRNKEKMISSYKIMIEYKRGNLEELKGFLLHNRDFLLGLLENANLLEHDSFTDMLWAVFHVADELICRDTLNSLPDNDYKHLEGDIERAYSLLIYEWLFYMNYLKHDYPYLYSLAIRKNPFNKDAKVIFD